ncbi:ATP-dependent translocase ABCB1 isoform X2 [Aplysia californica]|uniref:ATP-dependent translocase ABCB1 isoform X2 n=1 Tax=Aplysia californica TaxID=6500 RepID=A0ABM1W357_APLCA|nr:ATP-dependent translocase ABCB1 isoform X2 [Aplysia californica]
MAELKGYKSANTNGKVSPEGERNEGDGSEVSPAEVYVNGHLEEQNGSGPSRPSTAVGSEKIDRDKDGGSSADDGENGKKKKADEKVNMVGSLEVFRFSDWKDRLMMFVGSICAIANGAALPSMIVIFGEMIDLFVDTGKLENFLRYEIAAFMNSTGLTVEEVFKDVSILNPGKCTELSNFYGGNITCADVPVSDGILDAMTEFAIYYCIIGGGVMLTAYLQVAMWMAAAERQAHRIRQEFLKNVLRQDIGWYDTHEAAELNTRLADDVTKIQDGIGDKVGSFLQWFSSFVAGFVIGFVYGWKLTLVILAVSPFLAGAAGLFSKLAASMTAKELEAYAKAGAVAEEVFGAIRTVVAFGGQEKESERYAGNLSEAEAFGVKKGFTNGASMGIIWFVIMGCYALGFWYGGKLVREDSDYDVSNMIIVFFSVLIGAFSLGNAAPNIQSLATARGAAYTVFNLIDLKSAIDSSSDEGEKLSSVRGTIQFRNINFAYPSRPDVTVLDGMNLEALPGQTVALVGASGCGKSTTVQLLLRFYDPLKGQVFLDGKDIKDLNIKWLRRNIGLVSQEPVLFATTIAENIRYGREDVTMEEIIQAAKNANAYDFIMNLPQKFDTMVGERGAQLSGGQKQRVAIARALVRNPKILLLDEATSALDTESESIVQDALDKAREGRTTLVIAHRLSTIKTADIICGFDKGTVVEKGTHNDLMAKQGIYYQLVTNQSKGKSEEDEELEEMVDKVTEKHKPQRAVSTVKRQMSEPEDKKAEEEEDEKLPDAPFFRLLKMNAPEWHFILLACFGSIINGGVQPAFAVIFSEILEVFSKSESEQKKQIQMYCLIFVGLGVVSLITMFIQGYFFGKSGEKLTTRLRNNTFQSMLRQDIAWYDDHKNSVGALTTRLATDASLVQGVTGVRLGNVLMGLANMGTAIVISFIYGWKLTLVILGFMPFIVLGGIMEVKLLAGQSGKNKEALEGAGKVATESIENIRTVASLSKEPTFFSLYMDQLETPYKAALKRAHLVGLTYAFSQSIIYFAYATAFVFGAYLIEEKEMDYADVFLVFGAIVFGAMGLGNASAFAPDVGKAQVAAKRILHLLDSQPSIDHTSPDGNKLPSDYHAEVTFQSVKFRYPTRPTVEVLQGLSFSVSPGQTLALVGSSGCGKSTSVQLIERFYDSEDGAVCLSQNDLKTLNIQWLRAQIGIVSQEPVLFDRSIAENIAYGDNSRVVSMDEIISAARGANIHSFISSLPDGYNTNVGSKGTQLSGGQKQRVAIARALVRNPKILLLDEATSALDTESEKVVQEALDQARQGRTCVVIAHRLSTIQNADKICVVSHGKVSETGTHSELMGKQGFYYKLVKNSVRQ